MELSDTGMRRPPFSGGDKPIVIVRSKAHDATVSFLHENYQQKHGLAVLQGPPESGKATAVRDFFSTLPKDVSKAIVDGEGLGADGLLLSCLRQFGYQIDLTSVNERLNMLRVVTMQQAVAGHAPVLAVENLHGITASAMQVLCELAACKTRRESALRIVLMSDRSVGKMLSAPDLQAVATRVSGVHHLGPMTALETRDYLHAKLRAAGATEPDDIFPDAVCADVYGVSNGWPGLVDRMAMAALAAAPTCPVSPETVQGVAADVGPAPSADRVALETERSGIPRLVVSLDGKTLGEVVLDQPRLLIGRGEHNDLRINSKMMSRHHAMFVRHGSTTLLMDLNSTNGTLVNSRRVSNHVMRDQDVVSVGAHRIKFVHAGADSAAPADPASAIDTVIMKTLDDMRRMMRDGSTQTLPDEAMDALIKSVPKQQ